MLPWTWAVERLAASLNYWVATTATDGSPHVVPVWGLWLDDGLHFGTAPTTQMGRYLARDARVAVHLESGDEVVILKGEARPHHVDERVAAASRAKYGFGSESGSTEGVYRLQPRVAYAWRVAELGTTATRFDFT